MTLDEANAEAVRRIRAAKDCGQWWLDLGDLPIERVPEEIGELSEQLQVLALGQEKFNKESESWHFDNSRLGAIRDLESLQRLRTLHTINLSGCRKLADLEPLEDLTSLTHLNLSSCGTLTDLQPLQGLDNLTHLDLSNSFELNDLEPLKRLTFLTKLRLSGCHALTDLLPLRELTALTDLSLFDCDELTDLEPLQGMTTLVSLELGHCLQLADLRPLRRLLGLTRLGLFSSYVLSDIEPLRELASLTHLDLSHCPDVGDLEALRKLSGLESLDISCCGRLLDLSPLRELTALTLLGLEGCRATSFQPIRELLDQLTELKVAHSVFPDLHPSACGRDDSKSALDTVRAYYAALGPDAKPDAEVKVFVLGNGRCGKSYLIRRLTGMSWEQIEAAKIVTTHGVTIVSCPAPEEWGLPHPVTLSIWDFGGQDIYHGTHALFLREPAIYLLLYADATENDDTIRDGGFEMHNRRLDYWFDYLRQEAGERGVVNSPVLLIKSRSDEALSEVPVPAPDTEAFPNITPVIRISSKDPRGLRHLMPQLEDAIVGLLKEHPQPPLPVSWAKVRERIREMQSARSPRTMILADLQRLCAECGCNPGDEVHLREALALMGVVYYRAGVFDDRILVDQTWALDAIYTLFKRDHKRQRRIDEQNGRFTREDLAEYFWDEHHPVEDQRTFLSFMEQCGICFRAVPGYDAEYEGHYIIPDKLTPLADAEARRFENTLSQLRQVVEVTATFTLLHNGIARGFLSKIGSVAGDRATYWRYGCHFFDGQTNAEALVRTDEKCNTIRIQTWGTKAGELAQTLVKVLKDVPCGQPPEVTWADAADEPTIIEREDRDRRPERDLDPRYPRKVFVSYSHEPESKAFVAGLVPVLERHGWNVVVDLTGLKPGEPVPEFCYRVRECPFLVPVVAENYLRKRWCLDELLSFFEQRHCDLATFRRHTSPAAAVGQLDTPGLIKSHQDFCTDTFPRLAAERGYDRVTETQYKRIGRWANEVSDILGELVRELGAFGFADLRANDYAAVVSSLERKYATANAR